jgi:RHS repeat-associated protein
MVVMPQGYRTTFLYDAAGQTLAEIDPLARRVTYGYDEVGNLTLKRDPRGYRTTMVYDAANRMTARRYPDGGRHTFAYDPTGNRVAMLDATGRTTTTYNARSEVLCVANPGDKRITYTYDALGRRSVMTDPAGGRFTYSHDAAGRLTRVINPQEHRTSFVYDALAREVQKELANGSITTQVYDTAGRLTSLTNRKASGDVLSQFAYAYDNTGNRTSVVEADGTRTTWSYDQTYQLLGERRTTTKSWDTLSLDDWASLSLDELDHLAVSGASTLFHTTYTYDPAGNRILMEDSGVRTTYSYDAANEILWHETPTGRTTYTHDAAGNRIAKETTEGVTTYTWDADNRMTVAEPPAGVVTMVYNAIGQRVGKESPVDQRSFLYDFNRLLAEYDAADQPDRVLTSTTDEYGDLISERRSDHTAYHAYDALGSTEALLGDAESSVAHYAYRAFGLHESDTTPETPFLFVGRQNYYRDAEIELYLLGAGSGGRHYDPETGRFVCEDRIKSDANEYRYVHNRPSLASDPSGLEQSLIDVPTSTQNCICEATRFGAGYYRPTKCVPSPIPEQPSDSCGAEIYLTLVRSLLAAEDALRKNMPASGDEVKIRPNSPNTTTLWDDILSSLSAHFPVTRWDIVQLFEGPINAFGCNPRTVRCQRCVTVNGVKQDRYEVNYVLYGLIARMLGTSLLETKTQVSAWKNTAKVMDNARKGLGGCTGWWEGLEEGEDFWQNTAAVHQWVEAGYKFASWTLVGMPKNTFTGKRQPLWQKVNGEPLSSNQPRAHNPNFAQCRACLIRPGIPGNVFTMEFFCGLGGYGYPDGAWAEK